MEPGDNTLGELAVLATNINAGLKTGTLEKIKIGDWLNQARALLPSDSKFGSWCKNNFPGLGRHTRQNYMNVAKTFGGELFNTAITIPDTALYLLARPKTPKSVQKGFLELSSLGQKIKTDDVKKAIALHKDLQLKDEELYESLMNENSGRIQTNFLDAKRGGDQDKRISEAEKGLCVVAYPFDDRLLKWAGEKGFLIKTPNENYTPAKKPPFYNVWLYRNNPPNEHVIFDNYWRSNLDPKLALIAYKKAASKPATFFASYLYKLKGYVLFAEKIDRHWHGPALANLVNQSRKPEATEVEADFNTMTISDSPNKGSKASLDEKGVLEANIQKPTFDDDPLRLFKSSNSNDEMTSIELSERILRHFENCDDNNEIKRFMTLKEAIDLAYPFLKARLY